LGDLQEIEDSRESYIISRLPGTFTARIRSGALDVRRSVKFQNRIELSRPYLRKRFPLPGHTIREHLCSILSLAPQGVSLPAYEFAPFITAIIDPCPHLALVPLHKRRYRFVVEACPAEFTEISTGKDRLDSVAVGSGDIAATLRAVARLGLSGRSTRNYSQALRRLLDKEEGGGEEP
jgi:hypothetical protein